jgi:uncharacterized membrane protein
MSKSGYVAVAMAVATIALSIFFRFTDLDGKVFWEDEAHSAIRIAGFKSTEIGAQLFSGRQFFRDQIIQFQQPTPAHGLGDVISSASEMPEVPPLYYVIAYAWGKICGYSIESLRGLSAFISCFSFPLLFVFLRELFGGKKVGLIALMIVALSPFQLIYAQEARPYSLFIDFVLLSSWLLLKARKANNWQSWLAYGVSAGLGLWSQLLFLYVIVAHALWILVHKDNRKYAIPYFAAAALAFVLFLPWLNIIRENWALMTAHLSCYDLPCSIATWAKVFFKNICAPFCDLGPLSKAWSISLQLAVLTVAVAALVSLVASETRVKASLLLLLFLVPIVALALPDLISQGIRSLIPRYLAAPFLLLQIIVAAMFARHISPADLKASTPWLIALSALLLLQLASCITYLRSKTWWSNYDDINIPVIAQIIDAHKDRLVVGSQSARMIGHLSALSWQLSNNVRFKVFNDDNGLDPKALAGEKELLLFYPSTSMLKKMSDNSLWAVKSITPDGALWAAQWRGI